MNILPGNLALLICLSLPVASSCCVLVIGHAHASQPWSMVEFIIVQAMAEHRGSHISSPHRIMQSGLSALKHWLCSLSPFPSSDHWQLSSKALNSLENHRVGIILSAVSVNVFFNLVICISDHSGPFYNVIGLFYGWLVVHPIQTIISKVLVLYNFTFLFNYEFVAFSFLPLLLSLPHA